VVCFSHVNVARLGPLLPLAAIKAPYVVGALGVEVWSPLHWSKRLPLTRAAQVYAISDYTRGKVLSLHGVGAERCTTLHLALEDHWRAAADADLLDVVADVTSREFSLLTVCRLERDARDKGVDWVLRAVAALAPTHPELRYVVVGDGNDRSHLEGMATELGIQDRVLFRGRLDHKGLLAAYRDCDLFVLPTRREGFGLVFLEAMAYRKPIVAMASAGTLDVVTSGEQGLLIDDEAGLVDAIVTFIGDRALALRMGEAGYRTSSGPFSFDAFVTRLWALLSDVLRAPPS
jgi:glycosyltransferase involved in cell wall biosynthesis